MELAKMRLGWHVPGLRPKRGGGPRAPRTAFVLGGGGVLGAVQVGQLQALLERGLVPDVLVGTSVGALNAAAIAADPTPAGIERLREVWSALRSEDLFPGRRLHRVWSLLRGDHLYPNTGIRQLISRLPARSFDELVLPLSVGATNLHSGREHWFDSGPLEDALLASTALPGIFPPVAVEGDHFVDGGVVNNVPISRAIELGAERVYVLSCGAPAYVDKPIRRPLDVLLHAVAHSRNARVQTEAERYGGLARIEVLPTFDPGFIRFTDASHSSRLIERARDIVRTHLDSPEPEPAGA